MELHRERQVSREGRSKLKRGIRGVYRESAGELKALYIGAQEVMTVNIPAYDSNHPLSIRRSGFYIKS